MSIRVTCTACQRTFKVKDRFAGLKGSCLYCGRVVSVPDHAPTVEDFEVLEEAEEDEMLGSSLSLATYVPMTECPACHKEIIEGAPTCFYCGESLPDDEVQAEYVRGDKLIREQIHHEKGRKCVVAYAESEERVYFFIDTIVDGGSIKTQIHASDTPYEKQKSLVGEIATPVSGSDADSTHLSKIEDAINAWLETSKA